MPSNESAARSLPSRHARVWIDAATWRSCLRCALDAPQLAFVDAWVGRGLPLVVRRRDGTDSRDCWLGLASAPAAGRLRIPIVIDRAAIVRSEPPLRLDEIIDAAPPGRRAALAALRDAAAAIGTVFGVYGSFAWQAMSGDAYVTPTSDLDLLWGARDRGQVAAVVGLLTRWERASGLRADGEARFANGDAVAWRELMQRRVLVKRDDGVALAPSPLASFEATA